MPSSLLTAPATFGTRATLPSVIADGHGHSHLHQGTAAAACLGPPTRTPRCTGSAVVTIVTALLATPPRQAQPPIFDLIRAHVSRKKTGPLMSQRDVLQDVSGNYWEFQMESFSTSHSVLTLGYAIRQRPSIVQAGISSSQVT